ncbi:MAG: ComF family protein [Gammaproteobacteria bacterium]
MVYKRINLTRLLATITPATCLLCDARTDTGRPLCTTCREDLPAITDACIRCGRPLQENGVCAACLRNPPLFDHAIMAYTYEYPLADLIKALKYRHTLLVARELGETLAECIHRSALPLPDSIVPVPLHQHRLFSRGFNQALEIARVLSKRLQIPVDYRLTGRARSTIPQFGLSPRARRRNVKDAFRLMRTPGYRSVAIVDDIVTTGATVNELSALLKRAGVEEIGIWACARAV